MMAYKITYEAKEDNVGALVPLHHKRRCLVVKYRDGHYAYICGAFTTMKSAEKRAAYLNQLAAEETV